jgi:hypothetical protein
MSERTNAQLTAVFDAIMKIDDPFVGNLMVNSFRIALNTLKQSLENEENNQPIDISEQINQVCEILNVDLREMVTYILSQNTGVPESDKTPDAETLEFITSDLDDYEKFLAQNKAKESLEFLKGVI